MQALYHAPFAGANPIEQLANTIHRDCVNNGGIGGFSVHCFFTDEGNFLGSQGPTYFSVNREDVTSAIGRNFGHLVISHNADSNTQTVQAVQITWKTVISRFADEEWASIEEIRNSTYRSHLVTMHVATNTSVFPSTQVMEPCVALNRFLEVAEEIKKLFRVINIPEAVADINDTITHFASMVRNV